MSAQIVNHGDYLAINVGDLSREVQAALRAHARVMDSMTADEWVEWCALLDNQAKSDWLDARLGEQVSA